MRGRMILGMGAAMAALATAPARVYGADNIERMIRRHGRSRRVGHSLADQPHDRKREIARRLRQAERDRAKREARMLATFAYLPASKRPERVDTGLSRRGRQVAL